MFKSHQFAVKKIIVHLLIALFTVPLLTLTSLAEAPPLNIQVAQVAQQCQNGENLSAEQLQQTINDIDTLNTAINQSDHPQKKLFIIRLKKSRNMCLYFAQLKQQKEE